MCIRDSIRSPEPAQFPPDVEVVATAPDAPPGSLRPTVFATNFGGMWSAQIHAGDVVAGPYAAAWPRR